MRTLAIGLAALLGLLVLPAEAQWKWKDKTGRVQYSDLPPPSGTAEQDILLRPTGGRRAAPAAAPASVASGAAAASTLVPGTVDNDLEAKRKKAEAEVAAKADAKKKADEARLAAAKAENCSRAKNQAQTIESGTRLVRTNPQGEREYLDDRQRAEEMKRARDVISADCR